MILLLYGPREKTLLKPPYLMMNKNLYANYQINIAWIVLIQKFINDKPVDIRLNVNYNLEVNKLWLH